MEKMKAKLLDDNFRYKDKKVTEVTFPLMFGIGENNQLTTLLTYELTLTLEGRKAPVKLPVRSSYCPMCGVKISYEKEVADE